MLTALPCFAVIQPTDQRPMQIQTHGRPRETSEKFVGSVDAQTLRRLRASGAYDPSGGTLRPGRTVPLTLVGRVFTSGCFGKMTSQFFMNGCFVPMSLDGGGPQTQLMSCAATTFFRLTSPMQRARKSRIWAANLLVLSSPMSSWAVEGVGGMVRPIREREGLISSWPRQINSAEVLAAQ